jgi:hypothetical protein
MQRSEPLRRVLSLFTQATGASVVQRLGLRFINKLADPAAMSPQFWRDHIRGNFAVRWPASWAIW